MKFRSFASPTVNCSVLLTSLVQLKSNARLLNLASKTYKYNYMPKMRKRSEKNISKLFSRILIYYLCIFRELYKKLKLLGSEHDNMQKKTARLSLHNEELQYRLKQNAERYSVTINELSKSYQDQSSFSSNRMNASFADNSFLDCAGGADEGNSPPASPVIKGVVEKSDSVSWVLEMDDESPEVLANRLVRRAGSFRSEKCSPSPVPKKIKCQNNTSIQQSASATSILNRQPETPNKSRTSSNGRLRSKSVSASKAMETVAPPKVIPKIVRSISGSNGAVKNLGENDWNHTAANNMMTTSSPNPKKSDPLESMGDELIIDAAAKNEFFLNNEAAELNEPVVFQRDGTAKFRKTRENRGLITCDTTALTGSEKKLRRPKIHAGEAMIGGSNSEDEHSEEQSDGSASSTVSTGPSTPSISSSSTTSSEQQPIESIEDALLRWKEHNNTPMEVSWCEEGEPSESCV